MQRVNNRIWWLRDKLNFLFNDQLSWSGMETKLIIKGNQLCRLSILVLCKGLHNAYPGCALWNCSVIICSSKWGQIDGLWDQIIHYCSIKLSPKCWDQKLTYQSRILGQYLIIMDVFLFFLFVPALFVSKISDQSWYEQTKCVNNKTWPLLQNQMEALHFYSRWLSQFLLRCPRWALASVLDPNMIDLLGKIIKLGIQVHFMAPVGPQKKIFPF